MMCRRLPDKKETLTIKQIEIDGIIFDATPDLYDLLDELKYTDAFNHLNIKDDIAFKLKSLGIIQQNIRGSYSTKSKNKLKELTDIVLDVVYE